jgi:hypothetical protein
MLDGQRTCAANQSIGGQIHAAMSYTKLHDRLLRPLLVTSATTVAKGIANHQQSHH